MAHFKYTEEQKKTGNSLPAQVARLERYCHSKDYQILLICSFDISYYITMDYSCDIADFW